MPEVVESAVRLLPLPEVVMALREFRIQVASGRSPQFLTNLRLVRIGKRVCIWKGARIEAFGAAGETGPRLEIGDDTVIHLNFHCGAAESVKIGRDVLIAGGVYITDHDHVFDDPDLPARWADGLVTKPVVIGDGAWLGEGCVILKGVTVGRRAVIGANAVVTRDVPPFAIAGGIPARVIRTIVPPGMILDRNNMN